MMTIEEIMVRRAALDIPDLNLDNTVLPEDGKNGTPITKYMLCYRAAFEDYTGHDLCVDFMGYYPDADVYLLRWKD